jgi:hypothetical protein
MGLPFRWTMESSGRSRTTHSGRTTSAFSGLREPIVVILFLIAFFTGISGKPLDGVLLALVAAGLAWDSAKQARPASGPAEGPAAGGDMNAPPAPARAGGTRRPLAMAAWLAGGLLYAVVVGSFTRYSWPATAGVILASAMAVVIGWRGPLLRRPVPARPALPGAAVWGALLVAGGLWELSALLQQPTLTESSYAHPTISTLTDPALGTHAGRSLALVVWLALGWYLVER